MTQEVIKKYKKYKNEHWTTLEDQKMQNAPDEDQRIDEPKYYNKA